VADAFAPDKDDATLLLTRQVSMLCHCFRRGGATGLGGSIARQPSALE
jgi:hypothetical protein